MITSSSVFNYLLRKSLLSFFIIIMVIIKMPLLLPFSRRICHPQLFKTKPTINFQIKDHYSVSSSATLTSSMEEPSVIVTDHKMFRQLKRQSQYRREGVGLPKGALHERYKLVSEMKSGLPKNLNNFIVLGIESSCDDTGVSVVSSSGHILSNVVYSQQKVHQNFGGVVPSLAMEAHRANIDLAIDKAIADAGLKSIEDIDAIAVTKGPGLEICLRIGCRKAQSLAQEFRKPFVTAHHLEGHCMIARLSGIEITDENSSISSFQGGDTSTAHFVPKVDFPFLTFLASGGHTSILLCKGLGDYEFLGGTLDDALGEAFDKASRLLGLQSDVSGGAAVEKMAQLYKEKYYDSYFKENVIPSHSLKVPMRDKAGCDFSFAGLKSSFRKEVQRFRLLHGLDVNNMNAPSNEMVEISQTVCLPEDVTSFLCSTFQDIAFTHVEDKLKKALQYIHRKGIKVNGLVVVGGVAANFELRRRLLGLLRNSKGKFESNIKLIFPPVSLCTDNGVMPAWVGVEMLKRGISNDIENQEVIAKWPLGVPVTDLVPLTMS